MEKRSSLVSLIGKKQLKRFCLNTLVQGLFNLDYQVTTEPRLKRAYRDRPAKIVKESRCEFKFSLNTDALEKKIAMFGWRVYVSNHPENSLSLDDAVVAYRDEYLMERGFGRFKGFPLSLTPIYLQREDHIKGLIRLLSIALRTQLGQYI